MEQYKKDFIEYLIKAGALQFGEFTLKSGRISPYFINTGVFGDGKAISNLGHFYASAINNAFGDKFDVLFGPAYKGIPLSVTTASSLFRDFGMNKFYTFDRKELKKHGDKGALVGHKIEDGEKIIILDDVFTTGGTKEESIEFLNSLADVTYAAVVIAVDRKEVGSGDKSAIQEFEEKYKIPVVSIVNIHEIIEHLHNKEIGGKVHLDDTGKKQMEAYLQKYGVKE